MAYRLIHDGESDLRLALVLGRNLRPKAGKVAVRGTALANDLAVPAGVVVDVDDAHGSTGIQAALDLLVVCSPVVSLEAATGSVHEVLPADGNTEGVEAIIVDEVLHLVKTSLARVDDAAGGARSISAATEVETSDL